MPVITLAITGFIVAHLPVSGQGASFWYGSHDYIVFQEAGRDYHETLIGWQFLQYVIPTIIAWGISLLQLKVKPTLLVGLITAALGGISITFIASSPDVPQTGYEYSFVKLTLVDKRDLNACILVRDEGDLLVITSEGAQHISKESILSISPLSEESVQSSNIHVYDRSPRRIGPRLFDPY